MLLTLFLAPLSLHGMPVPRGKYYFMNVWPRSQDVAFAQDGLVLHFGCYSPSTRQRPWHSLYNPLRQDSNFTSCVSMTAIGLIGITATHKADVRMFQPLWD